MVDVVYILNYLNISYEWDDEGYLMVEGSSFVFWHEKASKDTDWVVLKSWYPEEDWSTFIGRLLASKVHS